MKTAAWIFGISTGLLLAGVITLLILWNKEKKKDAIVKTPAKSSVSVGGSVALNVGTTPATTPTGRVAG